MSNMVMLEWFIGDVCQIADKQEVVIINSRKPFTFIVFSNYHASQSIWKLPAWTFKLELSTKAFIFACIVLQSYMPHDLGHILHKSINFADFRFAPWLCIGKTHFSRERKVSSRLPVVDSKHKVSSRLPVADSKHKVSSGLPVPVADSVAGCRFKT